MSEQVVHDPKFVPAPEQLEHVGLSLNKVKSDNDLYKLISTNSEKSDLLRAQNAVAAYILWQRGNEQEAIAARLNVNVKTIERWCVAGAAILRTGEYVRTLAAVSAGSGMSKGAVDAATKGEGTPEERLDRLETAAVATHVKKSYVKSDGKALSDDEVAAIVTSLPQVVADNAEPMIATSMIKSVPHVSESFDVVRKEPKRSSRNNGEGGPQQVVVHLKAALKDARQIAKDSDADYVPTAEDVHALLKLVEYLLPGSPLTEDITSAVEALVAG